MTAPTLSERLAEHPFFRGLDPASLDRAARCATVVHFGTGDHLLREHEPADTFYVLVSGRVSIQVRMPTRVVVVDTPHDTDPVGWSWLVPPHRWTFDAVAAEDTTAYAFDAACLRAGCAEHPALETFLLRGVLQVTASRLHSARVRLLDLYGSDT